MTFYVYGLIDPTELPDRTVSLAEQLSAVIYVGKGTKLRSEDHANEARRLLEQEIADPEIGSDYGRKLDRLIGLFRAGTPPKSVKLAAGFDNEGDAYKVEAFAIEAINGLRLAHGRKPLTNAVKGHGVAIEPLAQYEARLRTERFEVSDRNGEGQLAILVKADLEESENGEYKVVDSVHLPAKLRELAGRVEYMEWVGDLPARRAWDVHMPWTDEEARERGRRFWKLGRDNVRGWIEDASTTPKYLFLAIEEAGVTTIRYAWHIEPNGRWEAYDGSKWGVPLGEPDDRHPLLNTVPVRSDGYGALRGNSGGEKLIRYKV